MKNEFDYLNDVIIDFSIYEPAELTEKEKKNMKKLIKHKKINKKAVFGIAAAVAVIAAVSVPGLAGKLMFKTVKEVSTGHNKFTLVDSSDADIKIPKELKGLLFDAEGKEVDVFKKNTDYYDKDGNKIESYQAFFEENLPEDGIVTLTDEDGIQMRVETKKEKYNNENPLKRQEKEGYKIIYEEDEIQDYLDFDVKLPSYIPEGFSFMGAAASTEQRYYLFMYYQNDKTGDWFMIHERLLNDETAFEAGTDGTMEEITINGHTAVLSDDVNVDFEINDVSVGVSGRNALTKDEVLKVSESIQ